MDLPVDLCVGARSVSRVDGPFRDRGCPMVRRTFVRSSATALIGLVALLLFAPPSVSSAQVQQDSLGRWVLLYACDGRPQWMPYSRAQLLRYVAAVDSAGRPRAWFSNGAIVLALYGDSGRTFTPWSGAPPSNGADWQDYLDCLLGAGGVFDRLDSALSDAHTALPTRGVYRVAVMIPYPGSGKIQFAGVDYDLGTLNGRLDAIDAYTRQLIRRFGERRGQQLSLDGMYWLHEAAYPDDSGLVHAVAGVVHSHGLRYLWIPYFGELAGGWSRWRALGFDEAWIQPNYFFNRSVPSTRVDSAIARARSAGMGLEIEFDGRLLRNPAYSDRLFPYLTSYLADSAVRRLPLALYDGGGALGDLSASRLPLNRVLYQLLAEVMQ